MSTRSLLPRHLLAAILFSTAVSPHVHAQGPDNPPVTDCGCPTSVSVTPDAPEKNGIISLKPTKEGTLVIQVVAMPPAENPIQPTFRIRQPDGKIVASQSAWMHTFTLPVQGLKSPLVLETIVDCTNFSSEGIKICDTKTFSFGGCESGACSSGSCQSGVGEPSGSLAISDPNPFQFQIPIGSSSQGDESTALDFAISPDSEITITDFKITSNGGHTYANNVITTDTTTTTLSNHAGGVKVEIKRTGSNDPFRTYQFNSVAELPTQTLTLVETRCDQQPLVHVWTKSGNLFSYSTANGLRTTTKTIEQQEPFSRVERHKTFELVSGQDVLVSDERLHYQTSHWGERLVQRDLDPDGANLTTTWSYGGQSDGHAYGKLVNVTRYDGTTETHTYGADFHQVDSSGDRQQLTTWSGTTTTTESRTNGILHARTVEIEGTNTSTSRIYTGASDYLETVTTYVPAGDDFGGSPATVTHPDGTMTKYTYARASGNLVTTVSTGQFAGEDLLNGTTTVTTENAQGQTIESITTDVPSQIVIAHTKALQFDDFGRPTVIGHFPDAQNNPVYSESRSYSCCKLTSQTDVHGVVTEYSFDPLGRQTHSSQLGVVQETVYKGLTTTSHRYPVGQSASAGNRIGESTRNLAGTLEESWQPDTSSNVAGTLVKTTSATTYNPGGGLSRVVVTTVPGNFTQTSEYQLDGRLKKSYGDLSPDAEYAYSVTSAGPLTARALLDGGTHREITGSQTDWAGRTVASGLLSSLTSTTLTAATTQSYQVTTGLHLSTSDPDGVITRFAYNARGEREITVRELNGNPTNDYGADQVTRSRTFPVVRATAPTVPVIRSEVHVWQDGAAVNAPTLVSYTERTPDGLLSWSWQIGGGVSSTASTTGPNRTITTTAPDGTRQTQEYTGGRLTTSSFENSSSVILHTSSFSYDSFGRPQSTTDSRTGTTSTTYVSATADVPASITDPGNRTTTFTYDNRGRRTHVDAPDTAHTNITVTAYNPDGSVLSVTGAQTYPVSYTYDYAGRMKTMTTTGSSGNVITAWNYSTTTGQLVSKRYNSNASGSTGSGPDYRYSNSGRLTARFWARPVSPSDPTRVRTVYSYTHGRLTSITYNDGTPNLGYTYDNLGRLRTVTRGGASHYIYDYDPVTLRLATEQQNRDTFPRNLHRHYDNLGRPLSLNLATTGGTSQYTSGYGYDDAGRMKDVWHMPVLDTMTKAPTGSPTFTYGYTYTQANPGDPRVGATSGGGLMQDFMPYTVTRNAAGGNPALTANRTYEGTRDALHKIENKAGGTVVSSYTYTVNPISQRTSVTTAGTAFAGTQANWTWGYDALGQVTSADHASTNASDRAYQYDTIGNREKTATGTLTLPGTANWISNQLNQYTTADGVALPTTPAPAPFDLDGNLTAGPIPGANGNNPGVQAPANANTLKWDAEGRLTSFKIGTATYNYAYDHLSRLITRLTGTAVVARYHYDGWNRIVEYNGSTLHDTFTWGLDLSGSMQGAGGVGGLLATRWVSSGNADSYPTYDGNGNVSEYLSTAGANLVHFEYDPFGNLTRRTGSTATRYQYRFSTKPRDPVSGLYYYGYRWYDPYTGRWINRDPIEESGGVNLYGFVGNDGVGSVDILGLAGAATHGLRKCEPDDCCPELLKKAYLLKSSLKERIREMHDSQVNGQGYWSWVGHQYQIAQQSVMLSECLVYILEKCLPVGPNPLEWVEVPKWVPVRPWVPVPPVRPPKPPGPGPVAPVPLPAPVVPPVVQPDLPGIEARDVAAAGIGIGAGYLIYRGVRMIPSIVFPPLWPTIPANATIP